MAGDLSLSSTVVANKAAISTDLDGEIVILDASKGVYFGLDEVGAFIWNMLLQPVTLGEIRDAILREYAVDESTCERDLISLIAQLAGNCLIVIAELPINSPRQEDRLA